MLTGRTRTRLLIGFCIITCLLPIVSLVGPSCAATPDRPEIWLAPADDVTQRGHDIHDFFHHPGSWRHAARDITRFSVPVRYLLITPPDVVARELGVLHELGIPLNVQVPAMPADKHVCGDGMEGVVWPGEPAQFSKKLKTLGVEVYSFSLDLPLTSAALSKDIRSCHLTIHEAAERTARATSEILSIYPDAKIIDIEVPTGMPSNEWATTLSTWNEEYRKASGRSFDGLLLDAWWKFDWSSAASATLRVLQPYHIPVGIILDASGASNVSASEWVRLSKRNACTLKDSHIHLNFYSVANWENMHVPGLPDSDTDTLTGLVDWIAVGPKC